MSEFAELLETLQFTENEHVQLMTQTLSGRSQFKRLPRDKAIAFVEKNLKPDYLMHFYFGINPVEEGLGRAKNSEVTRISSLYLDLDFKPQGLGSEANAAKMLAIAYEGLTNSLGVENMTLSIYNTGGGIQAYIPIIYDTSDPGALYESKLNVKRFELWVQDKAVEYGLGAVDTVSDPARLFRVPGSVNPKYSHNPKVFRVGGVIVDGNNVRWLTWDERNWMESLESRSIQQNF